MSKGLYDNDWIDDGWNKIHKTAIVHPNVTLGKGNTIGAYSVIGGNGEIRDVDQSDFKGEVIIGDNNVISEMVTIQRPYEENKKTRIGSNCIIMAHAHIGHNARIYDRVEICSGCIIGGYATVFPDSRIKIGAKVRNRISIFSGAVVGMGAVVTKHVPIRTTVYGNPATVQKKNVEKDLRLGTQHLKNSK